MSRHTGASILILADNHVPGHPGGLVSISLFLNVWVFCLNVPGTLRGQKRTSDPLKLELWMAVSHFVSIRNWPKSSARTRNGHRAISLALQKNLQNYFPKRFKLQVLESFVSCFSFWSSISLNFKMSLGYFPEQVPYAAHHSFHRVAALSVPGEEETVSAKQSQC